ncbi:unnamed protein product [Penicillium salamii]|nr:unnamed protein product [Penicillium salamii]CAG8305232.1 unnamed protein product [Penicillium salamii]
MIRVVKKMTKRRPSIQITSSARNGQELEAPISSMYQSLHADVAALLEPEGLYFTFHQEDDDHCEKNYDTSVMGKFKCLNTSCPFKGWSSKHIPITIRLYAGQRYNARVYHQRCKGCSYPSHPTLDNSYAERIAYRIREWLGIQQDRPPYGGRTELPHNQDLCEGCRAGHCLLVNQ